MEKERKLVLEEKDIKELEQIINTLPTFAKNVSENMVVSQSINGLMQFLGSKIIEKTEE